MTSRSGRAAQNVAQFIPSTAHFGRQIGLAVALSAVAILTTGCRRDMAAVQQAPIVDGNAATDPANANMAAPLGAGMVATSGAVTTGSTARPAYDAAQAARNGYAPVTRVAGESYAATPQTYGENYPAQGTQAARNEAYNYNTQPNGGYDPNANGQYANQGDDDQLYSDLLDPNVPVAQQAPPLLPNYQQPIAPGPDYLWTPGYWDYANTGYYYVPGNWVSAPFAGALWTPGWWGYTGRGYGWHRGYWGRHVGYYGGVNYGFGFLGIGYQGGYWNNDHFYYNRAVNHVDPRSVNNYVYQRNLSVANNSYVNNTRISYNGGPGGLQRRPLPAEFAAQRETHLAPLPAQVAERRAASENRGQYFGSNHGAPQQMFAAHPVIERNVNVPAQLAHPQQGGGFSGDGFNGNGFNGQRGGAENGAARQQQQAAIQQQGIANQQRQQQAAQQQRGQEQARGEARGQANVEARQQQQGRFGADVGQQQQQRNNLRVQQAEQQRQGTQEQARLQQQQVQNQQRVQQDQRQQQERQQQLQQGRQQGMEQQAGRQQQDALRQQQNQQRVQQQNQRAQQQDVQRAAQQQARQQQDAQRSQQQVQQRAQQEQARAQQQQPRQEQRTQPQQQQQQQHQEPQRQQEQAPQQRAPQQEQHPQQTGAPHGGNGHDHGR